jgi:threonine dehydrogenase-like Zn-dependent dehydrogenase
MKAAIIEKPGVLTVRDIPKPAVDDYAVLCKMLYGATCVGTDNTLIAGKVFSIEYPAVLGHESVGRVIEIGPKVKNFKLGDCITRVGTPAAPDGSFGICWGGFAEYGLAHDHIAMAADGLPFQQYKSFRVNKVVPPDIDPAAATMFITWRETLSYVKRMGIVKGARVLVLGSGGDGLAFAAHSINLGSVVVMTGSAGRNSLAAALGVAEFFDYHTPELIEVISKKYPDGFDFIIDAVGKEGLADAALSLLKPGGTIGIYGIEDYGKSFLNPLSARGSFTCYNSGYDESETHDEVIALIRAGKLNAANWLDFDNIFDLENINAAYTAVRARKMVKALIRL